MLETKQKPISKVQFLKDVAHEINMLKQFATPEELSRLDLDTFDFTHMDRCIYGQMTGSCETARAHELMDKACVRVTNPKKTTGVLSFKGKPFSEVKDLINGEYEGQTWKSWGRDYDFLSMLETYICLEGAKIKNIIKYLKDTTGKVKLVL